ncbi:MAG: hypothetical protein LBV41_05860 [Cytophagaceae bacterium]|jgi:hypothetical protein|nr:hypothetical protein [Cytophagaceae bacterium]
MKFIFSIAIFLLNCCYINAQQKWYIESSIGKAVERNNNFDNSISFTLGRVLGKKDYRIDIWGAYIFDKDAKNSFSTAALFTTGSIIESDKLILTASVGAGINKSNNISLITPLRGKFGYCITKNLLLGLDITSCINLSDHKNDSFSSFGLFFGFKF